MATDQRVILELKNTVKRFGGVTALSKGNFQLLDNEIHAIVGDNGAGKSTMLKVIAGAHQHDDGQYIIDGRPVTLSKPNDAREHGIATVFQDLALIDHLDASANLFLGRELLRRGPLRYLGVLDKRAMRRQAVTAIRDLKVGVKSVDQQIMSMSGGQRQAVAVARAVTFSPRIVIMDEPTAALGVRESRAVLSLIRELKAKGLSVIIVSHNMPDVFDVADRITVMRLGQTVRTVRRADTSLDEIVGMITGAYGAAA